MLTVQNGTDEGDGTIYPLREVGKSSVVSLTVTPSSATVLSVASGSAAGDVVETAEVAAAELPAILSRI